MTTKRTGRSGSAETANYVTAAGGGGLSMRSAAKGTLLVREPTTVASVLLTMFLYVCRRYLFLPTHRRVFVYLALLVASVAGDFVRFPRTYFAHSDTFLNQYLVKLGWFWTLLCTGAFLAATGNVLCRDSRPRLAKHAARLAVATFFWYFWTNAFNRLEEYWGHCSGPAPGTRTACRSAGHTWKPFDVSGHVFILVYSTLVMISEARPFVGWDKIQDVLRKEENARADGKTVATVFSGLSAGDLRALKDAYHRMTPYVQALFVAITVFVAVWELMLATTIMYFHSMPEKLLAGIVAMLTWFVTYKLWYTSSVMPPLPGEGFFKYQALQKSGVGV